MSEIVLITGGSRSGKSDFAQQYAEQRSGEKIYLATCPPAADDELAERISRHREQRQGKNWQTIEEQTELSTALAQASSSAVMLIDCLTLWVSNLLLAGGDGWAMITEDRIAELSSRMLAVCRRRSAQTIMVSGEVGCGVVPENDLARRYRDLVGRCNQIVAAEADEVYLVSCGIPFRIKG